MSDVERQRLVVRTLLWGVFRRLILLPAIVLVAIQLFYFAPKGDFFVSFKTAQAQSTFVGSEVPTRICRTRLFNVGQVQATATRTFYRSDSVSGDFKSFRDRSYSLLVEDGDECVSVPIKSSDLNLTAGFWKFHTDVTFKIGGYKKTTSYGSNVFQLFVRPTNAELEQQIRDQIDKLQAQLDEITGIRSPSTPPPSTTITPQSSTAKTDEPTTSAPPDQLRTTNPQSTISNKALDAITGLLQPVTGGI